jgi:hypothetical protein
LFQGIGAVNESWVMRQTGLRHVPGSYVYDPMGRRGGIMVGRHGQLHPIDRARLRSEQDLAVLTQADGMACAFMAMRGVAKLHAWDEGFQPALFIIGGGGRIAYWLAEAALAERGRDGLDLFLADVDAERDDELAAFDAWDEYLTQHLTFPFEAEVAEFQERGHLLAGDHVQVLRISAAEDLYGILVRLRARRGEYDFPLCDLEVVDKASPNYQMVDDYAVWFANR